LKVCAFLQNIYIHAHAPKGALELGNAVKHKMYPQMLHSARTLKTPNGLSSLKPACML